LPAAEPASARPGFVRGLFSGGTLCDEAMAIAADRLGPIASNIPLEPGWALGDDLRAPGHLMIDFGDDRLTRGRPHPMIDPSLRLERIAAEAADPGCGVLLLDVVLGYGAHPDPAASLAPAIAAARETAHGAGRDLAVAVSLIGSRGDPQGLDRTAQALARAGASVHASNAAAAREAAALAGGAAA
jgi:FdrA protein